MIEVLKSWVSNIIAIIFFITIIEIIIPNGSMKKYIGFVTGILIIITIMSPVVRVLGGKVQMNFPEINQDDTSIKSQINEKSLQLNSIQSRQVIRVYKDKLEKGIKEALNGLNGYSCEMVNCSVYEEQNEKFGQIKEIVLTMKDKNENNKDLRIKPIGININIKKESSDINTQQIPSNIRKEILRRITSSYSVEEEQIKIIYTPEKK